MTVRRAFVLLSSLLLGAACAVLVACGGGSGDGLIPARQASSMQDQLDRIDAAVRDGSCADVGDDVAALQREINDLSSRVDARLRARLQQGVNHLADIAPTRCLERRAAQQTTTTQTQDQTTQSQTTPTTTQEQTVPTETAPTDTTTTPPPTATTPPPTTTQPPTTTSTTPPGGATAPDTGTGDTGGATPQP